MKIVKGDLLELAEEGEFDVIIHGCNCHHAMFSGIAAQITKKWPVVPYYDKKLTKYGDKNKLGSYLNVAISEKLFVINAYTQYYPGKNYDYDAIRKAFKIIKRDFSGVKFGYPKIGAGVAGGDWGIISKIIDEEFDGEDHTLVIWDKE